MTLSRRRMAISLGGWLRTNCVMTQTQAHLTFKEAQKFELPEIVAGATSPTDRASLVPTVNRSSRPPSCSSRRDEAVTTDHATIGVRTKPYAPSEVSTSARVSSTHRRRESFPPPSPGIVSAAVAAGRNSGKPPSPSAVAAGDWVNQWFDRFKLI
ncbi:hypothetical protein DY000_02040165 [Brassica cretica]|uniref:Uncharacterized protein n=1 Tax=Brassica cretica TaxID=69181 RepID=A0ABQ7BE57_BRACR|nr:hypothetical protein DY000_02040165 [Brassica cretica]